VCSIIEERYAITYSEIREVEALFGTITSLPAYVEHNVFDKLVEVDY
jgi:hypothetical protein